MSREYEEMNAEQRGHKLAMIFIGGLDLHLIAQDTSKAIQEAYLRGFHDGRSGKVLTREEEENAN